ncbi:unnamed protein product [Rotaria sordida]|uniref:Fringe-like glycosyltransferase domain-containing protein n=1 Tax=Rotaria sordida TaxID=392033 RepID=A0A814Q7M7_9BILA|nr:unnamed protein product [Rotaria sordida]CAF4085673.1 unnamed protein product [Rotaria sordida]
MNTITIAHRKSFTSFICDDTSVNRFPVSSTTPSNDSFDIYRKISLEKYCNIVPILRRKWLNSQTYIEDDIAFVIFTASPFYHTRATATYDTWLPRITNSYFLSATPYPYLPVTVVPGAGEDKLSNMKKLFLWSSNYLSTTNESFYKSTTKMVLCGHSGRHPCPRQNNREFLVEFPSGGAGFFFSMKLLEIMQPHLTNYIENIWPRTSELSDVALACLATQLGVKLTKEVGFWAHSPESTLVETKRRKFHKESEPNNFHYIKPDEMYGLDEFYVNQHMDRLINDQNWDGLIQFTRHFVTSHYELLKKKRRECTLPKVNDQSK